jgi:hypothetical protein
VDERGQVDEVDDPAQGGVPAEGFFFLVVPYTFAIGCTFFGSAGFISGLYRLLTRNSRAVMAMGATTNA